MLRQIKSILFLTLWMPLYAASVESVVIPMVWDPGAREGVASSYARYVIPSVEGDSPFQAMKNYLLFLQNTPELGHIVPISTWKNLANSVPVQAFGPRDPDRPKVLLIANQTSDHEPRPKRLLEIIPQLEKLGIDPYVLPVGALGRLTEEERIRFYEHLGQEFKMVIALGGQDIDPSHYGEEINGAIGTNPRLDLEELHIIRGIYKYTNMHIFGICRGAQMIAVAFGAKLHQHIFDKNGPGTRVVTQGNVIRSNRLMTTEFKVLESLLDLVGALKKSGDGRYRVQLVHHHHEAAALEYGQPLWRQGYPVLQPSMRLGDGSVITGFEFIDRNGRIVMGTQQHIERHENGTGGKVIGAFCQIVLK